MRRRRGWNLAAARSGRVLPLLASALSAACSAGSSGADDTAQTDSLTLARGGYEFRLDSERSDPGDFQVTRVEDVLHVMTGPAGIAFRPADEVRSGDFQVEATFVQHGAPVGYREAYGLFVGGRDLDTTDQEYTYLLIRGTGDFLIKRRLGDSTETLVDWTPNAAVVPVSEEVPEPENRLAITSLEGETVFLINGVAVHGMPTPEARPHGMVGVRANHRLDIRVRDWALTDGSGAVLGAGPIGAPLVAPPAEGAGAAGGTTDGA